MESNKKREKRKNVDMNLTYLLLSEIILLMFSRVLCFLHLYLYHDFKINLKMQNYNL